ncbi:MAG: DUF4349 domain-containing protein [Candidatus Shapirobacteria bacterium]|nr:DUF4349 domain-containing protein [Candidatus Shapirobacteria bacterium]
MKLVNWIKNNKLSSFLLLALLVLLFYWGFGQAGFSLLKYNYYSYPKPSSLEPSFYDSVGLETTRSSIGTLPLPDQKIPFSESPDRLVVTETSLSLMVNEVRETIEAIINKTESVGGFMVSRSLSQPEEAPYGYISLRIPQQQVEEVLEHFRALAIKVVSEQVNASDITDQYENISEKLITLEQTKKRLEEIMVEAREVNDILAVQREIINLQNQIDSLRGRQEYLEKTARLSLVTIHLSTDELALPYQPSETFRPLVIFKQAVRSMILTLRGLARNLIWLGVYGVIWVPVIVGIVIVKRLRKKKR